ncbi:hypothetical protein ACU8DI_03390 [Psychroserpens sp. BH13MA-6]
MNKRLRLIVAGCFIMLITIGIIMLYPSQDNEDKTAVHVTEI